MVAGGRAGRAFCQHVVRGALSARKIARRHRSRPNVIDNRVRGVGIEAQSGEREAEMTCLVFALENPHVFVPSAGGKKRFPTIEAAERVDLLTETIREGIVTKGRAVEFTGAKQSFSPVFTRAVVEKNHVWCVVANHPPARGL